MTECSDRPEKSCSKCKVIKILSEFPKSSRYKSGFNAQCKECVNSHNKQYRDCNPEKFSETRRKHYNKNIDKMRAEKRKYVNKTKLQKSAYDITYRKLKKDSIAAYKKEWERLRRHDPIFKITRNLRRRIHHALMGNNKSDNTVALLGCSVDFFKSYIESSWKEGMDWTNYSSSGWHIDHIKPCHLFDLSIPEQQRLCFHYTNQRPLWAVDNLKRTNFDYAASMHNMDDSRQLHQEH